MSERYCDIKLIDLDVLGEHNVIIDVTFTGKSDQFPLAQETVAQQLDDLVAGREYDCALVACNQIPLRDIVLRAAHKFAVKVALPTWIDVTAGNKLDGGNMIGDKKSVGAFTTLQAAQKAASCRAMATPATA